MALIAAGVGVYVLTGTSFTGEPVGLAFASANAGLFTAYIVLGHRVASSGASAGIDSLGLSMIIAAVVAAPVGLWDAGAAQLDPVALLAGAGVGVSSSVIRYVTDQVALSRLARSTYALFVSLLPATANDHRDCRTHPDPVIREVVGITFVIVGVALHESKKPNVPAWKGLVCRRRR